MLRFIGKGHKPINIRFSLPKKKYFQLNFEFNVSSNSDVCPDFLKFSFWILFEIKICEEQFFVMLIFPESHFGVIVHLVVKVLSCPLVIFGLPFANGLAVLIDSMVVIISKDKPVVIQSSSFTNTEEFCF